MNLLLRLGKKPVLAINFAGARLNLLLFKQREVLAMDSLLLPRTVLEGGLYQDPKRDRKSTRLNSSHARISYAVFCLKKKS